MHTNPTHASPIESAFSHGLREPHDPRHHNVDVRHLKKEHVDNAVKKMMAVIPGLKPEHDLFLKNFLSEGRPMTGDHELTPIFKALPLDSDTITRLFTPTTEELLAAGITPRVVGPAGPVAGDVFDLKCIFAVGVAIAQTLALAGTAIGVFLQVKPIANALKGVLERLAPAVFKEIQDLLKAIKDGINQTENLKKLLIQLFAEGLIARAIAEWASGLPWWRVAFDVAVALANVSLWFVSGGTYILVAIACIVAGIVQLALLINDAIEACKGARSVSPPITA